MVKIRLCSESAKEVEIAVDFFTGVFPDMRFSAVRMGSNPKYAEDPKYFSYGEPRVKNKKPIPINFKTAGQKLTTKAAAVAPKKVTQKQATSKPSAPSWQTVLGVTVTNLTWNKCRKRYAELMLHETDHDKRNEYVAAMEAAAKFFGIAL